MTGGSSLSVEISSQTGDLQLSHGALSGRGPRPPAMSHAAPPGEPSFLTVPLRPVRARLAADPDPREPVRAGDHLAGRARCEEHELAGMEVALLTLDPDRPAPPNDRIDLLLAVLTMVVLGAPQRWMAARAG